MLRNLVLSGSVLLLACPIGDVLDETAIWVIVSSSTVAVNCDTVVPTADLIQDGGGIRQFEKISSDPDWEDTTCLTRWKLDGQDYVGKQVAVRVVVYDSLIVLDTITVLEWKQPAVDIHCGTSERPKVHDVKLKLPLGWLEHGDGDTLFYMPP